VTTDGAGHIAIGGTACGPNAVDFGGGHTVNWWPGTMHAQGYVTGFDGAGTSLWIDPLTNIDESGVSTRLHDANAAGQLAFSTNSTPFGGGSYTHYGVIDAAGVQVWLRTMKNFSLSVQSLALDVTGGTLAKFSCFGAACSIGVGGQVPVGISLVKLSAAGAFGWQKTINLNDGSSYATAGFPTGEFLGFTGSGFNFGCGPVSAHLARFDASGACVWAKSFLGSVPALHAATNAAGEALVVATFTGLVDFGCGPVSNAAGTSLAVSKFNAAGTCLFTKTFTGPGFALGPNADPFPAPHSTGAAEWLIELPFKGAIDLGGGPISPPDPAKAQPLFIKLDASGNPVWSRLLVTPYAGLGDVNALGFTGDPSGGMVLLSNDPMLDLGSGAVLGGNVGLFLARFAP
jgi:hypothetical protein